MPSWSRGCMGLRMRLARETGDAATPAVSIPTAADCHYVVKVKSAVGHCYSGPAPPPPSSLCTRSAMNCMLWPPVEWKMSLHLSKSLAFAHCPIKFAASQPESSLVSFPDLVIFLARRTLRIRNIIFFVQVIHSCRPGYSSSSTSSSLLRAVDPWQRAEIKFDSKLTVWGWHTANLLANLICRSRRCREKRIRGGGSRLREWTYNWIAN